MSSIENSFCLIESGMPGTVYDLYLYGDVEADANIGPILNKLRNATELDEINIYINSPGGSLELCIAIYNILVNSPAQTNGYLDGEACSAAAFILLACSSIFLNDNTLIMLHNFSGGIGGKGHEIKDAYPTLEKHGSDFVRKVCKRILTDEEIIQLLDGKDFWMTSEEFATRHAKIHEVKEKLLKPQGKR